MADVLDLEALAPERLVLVGYSGRDQAAVQAHVEELLRHGVPAPATVPAVWEVPVSLVTQSDRIRVGGGGTSGEAEPVIVVDATGRPFLTVGSDHTDRELERTSMEDAKQACSKVVSRWCWPLPDGNGWDRLQLRSRIRVDGSWQEYQLGSLASILPPEWYLERFAGSGGAVIFCGTVPTVGDLVTSATAFQAELEDPVRGETIGCTYEVVGGV